MEEDFPVKNKKRALRRAYKIRKLKRVQKIAENKWAWKKTLPFYRFINKQEIYDWVVRHADNMKSTQCACCGNPRKYFKKDTIQEKKIEQVEKEYINDISKISGGNEG